MRYHFIPTKMARIKNMVNSKEKTLMPGTDRRQEQKGMTEDEMVGWHH